MFTSICDSEVPEPSEGAVKGGNGSVLTVAPAEFTGEKLAAFPITFAAFTCTIIVCLLLSQLWLRRMLAFQLHNIE